MVCANKHLENIKSPFAVTAAEQAAAAVAVA